MVSVCFIVVQIQKSMIQQITDGSNTCFAQKYSSVTAVMNGNIPRKNIYTHYTVNVISQSKCRYHAKAN